MNDGRHDVASNITENNLATLQAHFWDYLRTQPEEPPAALQRHVVDRTCAPRHVRLGIYRDMYRFRLIASLRADFPRLAVWLGDDAFANIAGAYLSERPSCDPDIGRAGEDLPAFLLRVAQACEQHVGTMHAYVAAELAAFEQARAQVFTARDAQAATLEQLRAVAPEAIATLHITLVDGLCVVEATHDVATLWGELVPTETETHRAAPAREKCTWAVWRRGDDVLHASLTPLEHKALQAARADATFAQICEVFAHEEQPVQAAFAVIGSWLADGWIEAFD